MATRWIKTTDKIYQEIYSQHKHAFQVFGTYTNCHDNEIFTEWGFLNASYPIIKSEQRGDDWKYYLACITKENEE